MLDLFFFPFFQRALVVGLVLGVLMAIVGVLVVLRRLSFFSDAIGHSALTGIAIGIITHINPFIAALAFTGFVATGIAFTKRYSKLPIDTLLGVAYPVAVSIGIILLQQTPGYQSDLVAVLFGDILTVSTFDVFISIILASIVTVLLIYTGKSLITIAVDEPLAHAEGIAVFWHELLLLLILASVITLAIKLVGIVLVTAMIVIPAAAAQHIARSLSMMFVASAIISVICVTCGMLLSAWLNLPSGPVIVLTAALCFAISFVWHPAAQ